MTTYESCDLCEIKLPKNPVWSKRHVDRKFCSTNCAVTYGILCNSCLSVITDYSRVAAFANGGIYCSVECFNASWSKCATCGECAAGDARKIANKWYCSNCRRVCAATGCIEQVATGGTHCVGHAALPAPYDGIRVCHDCKGGTSARDFYNGRCGRCHVAHLQSVVNGATPATPPPRGFTGFTVDVRNNCKQTMIDLKDGICARCYGIKALTDAVNVLSSLSGHHIPDTKTLREAREVIHALMAIINHKSADQ